MTSGELKDLIESIQLENSEVPGVKRVAKELQSYFFVDGNVADIVVKDRFDQISTINAIEYLIEATKVVFQTNKTIQIDIDISGINLSESLINYFIVEVNKLREKGLLVNIITMNQELSQLIENTLGYEGISDIEVEKDREKQVEVLELEEDNLITASSDVQIEEGVIQVNVRELLKIDTISKTNDDAWRDLIAHMERPIKYEFDFRGIRLIEPWNNGLFARFISDIRVYMVMYSAEKTVETIEKSRFLAKLPLGRTKNIELQAPKQVTPKERRDQQFVISLQRYFDVDDEEKTAVFQIANRFTQVENDETVTRILEAIKLFSDNHKNYLILVNLGKLVMAKHLIEMFIDGVNELISEHNLDVEIQSINDDVENKIEIHQELKRIGKISTCKRVQLFKEIKPGTVGMLTQYRDTKAVDEFGRKGNGEIVSCRVAIFNGITGDGGDAVLTFTVFDGNTFYTAQHWAMENDGEELDELISMQRNATIEEVGLRSDFLGNKYHFMKPIQYQKDGYETMYLSNSLTRKRLTIPERIKEVFDDWGITYDTASLDQYIQETNSILDIN